MDTQEPVSFHTSVEGNDQYLLMILDDQFRFLSIPEEITPTPELVAGIIFVVKVAVVTEGQLLLNHGGQQSGQLRQQTLGGQHLQEEQQQELQEEPPNLR